MDEKKRKKRQSISISRKNVLDLGFTIGIILIACLVSSLLVHYSKLGECHGGVYACRAADGAGDGRIRVGRRRLHHRRRCRGATMHSALIRFSSWILRRQVIRLFLRP